MTHIIGFGGVNEIGGNKFLLEDRDTKVFLDFGAGFTEGLDYFDAGIAPRGVNGAGDYFEFGLLPEIRGLYSETALQNTKLRYTEPEIYAIIASHYHMDHVGRIEFVDEKIPVYCGETTALIHDAYSSSTGSPLDDHHLETFRTGDKIRVGDFEIVPVHVDHSIPGAYGFIIHTSAGAIVYTGDFRFHGPLGSMTHEFVTSARDAEPVALVTEGTRFSPEDGRREFSEKDVVTETVRVLRASEGLVFSSFRGNDVDRVNSFFKACKRTGRRLVVSMRTAVLLESLKRDKHLQVPRVGSDVLVYVRRKQTGKYDDKDYYRWERPFLDHGVTAGDVRRRQKELFLHLDVLHLPELVDIKPQRGGSYIHAASEAFNEEGEREEDVIKNWASHFGFSYHQIHASGHAPMNRVLQLVRGVNARKTIPVHTEYPGLFSRAVPNVIVPKKGVRIRIRQT